MDQQRRQRRETSAAEATQAAYGGRGGGEGEGRSRPGTIRAVTPEASDELQSPPHSPRSHTSQPARGGTPRNFVARSSSDTDYPYRNGREQIRPRGRTLEETRRDRSPPTAFLTGRHRIGSVASTPASFQSLEESVVTSIGHPSTIPASPTHPSTTSSSRTHPPKPPPPRTTSPAALPTSPESWSSPVPASDARKLKALMRATCGKMQGLLAFRRGSNTWSLSYCYINEEAGSLVY